MLELSEHGIVLIVEESGCLQAKVYLKREVRSNSIIVRSLSITGFFIGFFFFFLLVIHSLRLQRTRRTTSFWSEFGAFRRLLERLLGSCWSINIKPCSDSISGSWHAASSQVCYVTNYTMPFPSLLFYLNWTMLCSNYKLIQHFTNSQPSICVIVIMMVYWIRFLIA